MYELIQRAGAGFSLRAGGNYVKCPTGKVHYYVIITLLLHNYHVIIKSPFLWENYALMKP